MKLAIIGTAGRKDDAAKLNRNVYIHMGKAACDVLDVWKTLNSPVVGLVSGGAAWADHLAVRLFLKDKVSALSLHLPCEWDKKKKKFVDTGEVDYKTNPGGTANYYHTKFSATLGIDSLKDIHEAIKKGAKIEVTQGFMQRNTKVALEADAVLAMTFGNGAYIKDGGTADTVAKYFARPIRCHFGYHFDLNSLKLHDDIIML